MEHHLTTYITHDTLISALGFSTQENLEAIRAYHSGITLQTDKRIADTPLLAATISQERLQQQAETAGISAYTRMEQLFILTINDLIRQSGQTLEDKTCGLILSTTKGNIDLLTRHTEHPDEAVFLWKMAENIAGYFHAEERVHVISNACISGVSALVTKSGKTRRATLQKRRVSKSTKTTRTRKTVSPVLSCMTKAHRFLFV